MIRSISLSTVQQLFCLCLLGLSLCSFQKSQTKPIISKKLALAQKARAFDSCVVYQNELVKLLKETEDEALVLDAEQRFLNVVFGWEDITREQKTALLQDADLTNAWKYAYQIQLYLEEEEQDSSYFYLSLLESLENNTEALGYTYGTFARNFVGAIPDFKEACYYLQKAENLIKEEDAFLLLSHSQIAVYQAIGDYRKAKKVVFNQIQRLKSQLYIDSIGLADCYHQLATIYWNAGDFISAQNYSGEAINYVADRIGIRLLMQRIWATFSRSAFYAKEKGSEGIVLYLRKALSLVPITDIEEYIDLSALLAEAFAKVNMIDSATVYVQKAKKVAIDAKLYLDKVEHATYVLNKQSGDLTQALNAIQRAWQQAEMVYGKHHWVTTKYAFVYGQELLGNQRYKAAYEVFKQAFSASLVSKTKYGEWSPEACWSKEMTVEILVGQVKAMLGLYGKSKYNVSLKAIYEMAEFNVKLLKSVRYKTARTMQLAIPVYEQMIEICLLLNERQPKESYLTTAFKTAEEFKQLFLNETIKEPVAQTYGAVDPLLIQDEYAWQELLQRLESGVLTVRNNAKQRAWYQEQIAKAKAQLQLVVNKLKKSFPAYYQQYYQQYLPTIDSLQQHLGDSTIVVQYMEGNTSIYQFLITADTFTVRKIFWRTYKNILLKYYKHFTDNKMVQHAQSGSYKDFCITSYELYHKLLHHELLANKERLVIIPDGLMMYIPFEPLLTKIPLDSVHQINFPKLAYLMRDKAITYHYSSAWWLRDLIAVTQGVNNDVLAMGATYETLGDITNRTYRWQQVRKELEPLPRMSIELDSLAANYAGDFYTNRYASEYYLKDYAKGYGVLHFAFTGIVDPQAVEYTNLVLAEDGYEDEDNFLTINEIKQLNLNAELVVLSNSTAGYGAYQRGEALINLVQGFMYAGSPAVVASLWDQPAPVAALVMDRFYKYLQQKLPKDEALRQAKIAYLKQAKGIYAHPTFWAGFIQIGNYQPIEINEPVIYIWWFIIPIAFIGLLGWWSMRALRQRR